MFRRIERITGRFLAIMVLVATLVAMLVAAIAAWAQFNERRARLDAHVTKIGRLNASALGEAMWNYDVRTSLRIIDSLAAHPEVACAKIFDSPLVDDSPSVDSRPVIASDNCQNMQAGFQTQALPIAYEGRDLGRLILWVDDRAMIREAQGDVLLIVMVFALLTAAMVITAVLALRATVMEPLGSLNRAIQRAGRAPPPPSVKDELGRVVTAYNGLLERIDAHTREIEEARAQAVAATQAKSRFLATMSHEIRTPMHAVMGAIELLHESPLNNEQQRYAEVISRSARTLLSLINDILDLSRIEAGKVELTAIPSCPHLIAHEVVAALDAGARAKNLRLTVTDNPDAPPWVMADPLRLRQILTNLVGNAVKFTDLGSVTVSVSRSGAELELIVQDTGIGIPEEKLRELFLPFSQLDASTTRRYGGSGLGLSISRQLVEVMGGRIEVTSALDEGSTFRVFLPLVDADPMPMTGGQTSIATPATVRRGCVLAAEDNPVNQWLLRTQLERLGYEADIYCDGAQALNAFQLDRHVAVITDYHMPVMDGLHLTRAIRAAEANSGRHIPIIGMTADAFVETINQCHRAGMDEVVTKPASVNALGIVLGRFVEAAPELSCASAVAKPEAVIPPSEDAPPLFDAQMGLSLFGDDVAMKQELLEMFIQSVLECQAAIAKAMFDGDAEKLSESAHALASGALSIGATRLGQAGRALERAALTKSWSEFPALADAVNATFDETRALLKA